MNPEGTLFGTSPGGGKFNEGFVYSFAAGTYSTLASFCNRRTCLTGGYSQSALIEDASGNLYGVAPLGGRNGTDKGTVFELTGSSLKALYSFCALANCTDGAGPYSKLLMNSRGALFGTTTLGGAFNGGAIFKLP